jgi:3' terminal RNA ribose 2'-O-methyltransferase Hen1
MLLTITTTHQPATDLGYLLHKNPAGVQSFSLAFGQAHVFYPHATPELCTAALLLDIDPVGLVRRRGSGSEGFALEQYVNDRPYVASSFLSVAISEVFGTALTGRSKERQELADTAIPLVVTVSVLPSRGGESFLRRLFEPLGYSVVATRHPLDEQFPEWGESRYFSVELSATTRLRDMLAHLYVLIPVLDDAKHYFVAEDEVAKLLRRGEGWLAMHPERNQITERYLKRKRSLVRSALAQLAEETEPEEEVEAADREEEQVEARISLNQQRIGAVLATLKAAGATTVLDLATVLDLDSEGPGSRERVTTTSR